MVHFERFLDRIPMKLLNFFVDVILSAAFWPWDLFSLTRKLIPGIFLAVKGCRRVTLIALRPSLRSMSTKCESLHLTALWVSTAYYRENCKAYHLSAVEACFVSWNTLNLRLIQRLRSHLNLQHPTDTSARGYLCLKGQDPNDPSHV
jgi:hypothetical protein